MYPNVVVAARACRITLALLLVLALTGWTKPAESARADVPPATTPVATASITQMSSESQTVTYSTPAARVISSSLSGGLWIDWGDGPHSSMYFESDAQRPLHTGVYPDVQPQADTGTLSFDVYGDRDFEPFHGEFDVLDLATDADGNFTRLDIVFITSTLDYENTAFGEVRLNEPGSSSALSPSALALRWPTMPRDLARTYAVETLTNTSGSALRLGTAKIRDGSTDDFHLRKDRCSHRTLTVGASCTLEVGFSATRGGPRNAILDIPAGPSHLTVSLAGTGRIGTTKITASGSAVRGGKTTVWKKIFIYPEYERAKPNLSYVWEAGVDTQGRSHHIRTTLYGPQPLATGNHPVNTGEPYSFNTLFDSHCGDQHDYQHGTIDIKKFRTDNTNIPVDAKINFDEDCGTKNYHGQLQWQDRDDTTPPTTPSNLRIVNGKARWKNSPARDYASTVARVLPGAGSDGLPVNGYPVSSGRATSAALPRLANGHNYTLLVWSVDKTGNVSAPATLAFNAGTVR